MVHCLRLKFCFLSLLLLCCVGCGRPENIGFVTVKVEYRGESVPEGTRVFFQKSGGYIATATVKPDGTYELKYRREAGVAIGSYVVFVGAPKSNMTPGEFQALKDKVDAEYRARGEEPPRSPDWTLPQKYYLTGTSPLRFTVEPGSNEYHLVLEDD